jgi:hypothetical protein
MQRYTVDVEARGECNACQPAEAVLAPTGADRGCALRGDRAKGLSLKIPRRLRSGPARRLLDLQAYSSTAVDGET